MSALSPPTAKATAAGGTWLFIGSLAGRLLVYVSLVLLARYLEPDETGRFLLALTIVQGIVVLGVSGIDQALFHFAPPLVQTNQGPALRGLLEGATLWLLLAGFSLAGLLAASAPWIARVAGDPLLASPLIAFSAFFPFMVLLRALTSACQALSRIDAAIVLRNIVYPVFTAAGMILLLPRAPASATGAGVMGASSLLAVLIGWVWLHPSPGPREAPLQSARRLLRFAYPLLATATLGYLTLWTDSLIVGFYLPADDMATYGLMYRLSMVGVIIVEAFSGSLGPAAARTLVDRPQDLQDIYAATTRRGMLFFLPVCAVGFVFPETIASVFGAHYASDDSVLMLRLLMGAQFVNVLAGGAGMLLVVAARRWLSLANGLGAALINATLCLILVPRAGVAGAALAAASSIVTVNVARILETHIILGVHPFSRPLLRPFIAIGAATLAGWGVAHHVGGPEAGWYGVATTLLAYALAVSGLEGWLLRGVRGQKNGPRT